MTTSSLRRQMKNIVHNYTEAEIKVREATSNDPWGPSTSVMSEIADLTYNAVAFSEVMDMIWRRLNDSGKNWRHVYKALTLLDYLIKTASDKVAHQCRENLYTVQTLKDFQFIDRDGKDQGINVREKAKQIVSLLKDEERLKQERDHALKTKERMSQGATGISSTQQLNYSQRSQLYGEDGAKTRCSPASDNSASSASPHLTAEIEQARPQTSGEEELQLQLALAMSREEADKPVAPATDADEELQLQLALNLSKQDHEKEVKPMQGEESLLQTALSNNHLDGEVHKEEKKNQSSLVELVDLFGPAAVSQPSSDPWGAPFGSTEAAPTWTNMAAPNLPTSTSWEQMSLNPSMEQSGKSWHSSDPWAPTVTPPREDHGQTIAFSSQSSSGLWDQPAADLQAQASSALQPQSADAHRDSGALGEATFDVFETLPGISQHAEPKSTNSQSILRSLSPVDLDLFGDPLPGTKSKADTFDMSEFGSTLVETKERTRCRTPESFLDPSASSLVNLDALIPVPGQSALSRNPFLSGGLSTPSPTNPFQVTDQKPTLNQMRNVSPVPGHAMGTPNSGRTSSPLPGGTMGATLTPTRTISPVPGINMGSNLSSMRTVSPVPGLALGTTMNSMTCSTSLPLPLSSLPTAMCLPSSMSAYQQGQGTAFQQMPGTMPQPLLPFSSSIPHSSSQPTNNPFL